MKKLYAIVFLGFLLLGYIGCGGGGVATTGSPGHSLVTMNLGLIKTASRAGTLLRTETGIPPEVITIRITISAPDIIPSIVKIIDVAGSSSLSIVLDIPSGLNRHFVVEALDASGNVLYRGETYVNLDGSPLTLMIVMVSTDPIPPVFAGIDHVQDPALSSLTLAWSPASDNITTADKIQYLVYMSTASNGQDMTNPSYTTTAEKRLAPAKALTLVNGMIMFTVNDLLPATTYYFKVRAMDERGNVDPNTVEKFGTTLSPEVNPPIPPDQQFVDFTPSAGKIINYNDLTFSVVNNGNIPAYNVPTWVLYESGIAKPAMDLVTKPSVSCESYNAHSLNPGIPVKITLQYIFSNNYLIIVDPENAFAESNESNNTACGGSFCKNPPAIPKQCSGPPRPDLTLNGIVVDYWDLNFNVMNRGNATASNVLTWVVYGIDNTSFTCEYFTDPTLAPGGSVAHFVSYYGSYTNWKIIVDPMDTILESNESNNTACGGSFCTNPPTINDIWYCFNE